MYNNYNIYQHTIRSNCTTIYKLGNRPVGGARLELFAIATGYIR